ncbi:hypothetical protein CPB84DRAFT_367705 [Gymnopilus junonius]|uniref:Uncharacterized protein n=1 Tax=Gymnopilus junonius TaxID=109634 RepID=A0A9P5TS23_GYMJU|nr:hypothetical protein CPB84DRAFT_367705 [Gymnopilus junonius]
MQRGRSASAPHRHTADASPAAAPTTRLQTSTIVLDDRHIPGSASCLCPSCHLRTRYFPRRRDGRIVLPSPTATPTATRRFGDSPQASRGVRDTRQPYPGGSHLRGREGDQGHISGEAEDWILPPLLKDFDLPNFSPTTPPSRVPVSEVQPSRSDHLRASRKKPYDISSRRPDPWPRTINSEVERIRPAGRSTSTSFPSRERHTQHSETLSSESSAPYKTIVEEPFPLPLRTPAGVGHWDLEFSGASSTTLQRQRPQIILMGDELGTHLELRVRSRLPLSS